MFTGPRCEHHADTPMLLYDLATRYATDEAAKKNVYAKAQALALFKRAAALGYASAMHQLSFYNLEIADTERVEVGPDGSIMILQDNNETIAEALEREASAQVPRLWLALSVFQVVSPV